MRRMSNGLLGGIPVVLGVTFVIFLVLDLAPGDPAAIVAGENASAAQIEQVRDSLGLDRPLIVRYAVWLAGAAQGNLGDSSATGQPVSDLIGDRLGVTLSLVTLAMLGALVFALVLGPLAAIRPRGVVDRILTVFAAITMSLPSFWVGMILVVFLGARNHWFPVLGYSPLSDGVGAWANHLVLPAVSLGLFVFADLVLQVRASMIGVLGAEYITTAYARGLSTKRIVIKHALKNACIPLVTVFGFRFASILGGTVAIEVVFNLPGLGSLAVNAAFGRDFNVLLGIVAVTAVLVVLINLVVDASYGYFNPRSRA